jgi:hypothetical protein
MTSFLERHDWKIWAGLGVLYAVYGLVDVLLGGRTFAWPEEVLFYGATGMTWDQLQATDPLGARFIDSQARSGGTVMVVVGLLSVAIAVFGLRQGQRWAWWTMWIWPLWLMSVVLMGFAPDRMPGAGVPLPVIAAIIFLVVTVATLTLTYRKYNPGP